MTVPPGSMRRTGVGVVVLVVCLVLAGVLAFSILTWVREPDSGAAVGTSTQDVGQSSAPSPTSAPGATAREAPRASGSGSGAPPPRATEAPGRPGWVALRTPDGWSYQVPRAGGWTHSQDVLAYVDGRGKVLARATQPSYLRAGACSSKRSVARATVGWAARGAGTTSAEVATSWARAVAVRDDGSQDPVSRVVTRPIRSAQMDIEHSVVLVSPADATGCLPRQVQVSATSYRGEGGTRTLVIVRDLGVAGALSTTVKELIVRGVAHEAS